eukprot:g7327.t1
MLRLDGLSQVKEQIQVGKCHKVDSNKCIAKEWSEYGVSKCSQVKKLCTRYNKNMHRCCPSTCGVEPICTKSECEKLSGKGTCESLPDGGSSSSASTKSEHSFRINSYESITTDVYEWHNYYAETRPKAAEKFENNMNLRRYVYDYASEEEAYTRQCVDENFQEGRTALTKVAKDNGFSNEIAHHCPYIYKASDKFRKTYTVERAHTEMFKIYLANQQKLVKLPSPKPTESKNYYDKCSNKFNTFTNGNRLNCLNCAIQQKLSHVHIKTTKERETQHDLIHALKVASKSTKVYDDCEQTFTCAVKPKFTDQREYIINCVHVVPANKNRGKRINSKTTCAKDCRLDMKKCAFKELTKKIRFHKRSFTPGGFTSYKTEENHYCKRLMNIADPKYGIAKRISDFLKDKTFSNTKTTCPVSEHMNLLKENAVDVHVDTTAKDLQFKVLGKEEDKFITEKNMKYDGDNDLVNIIYDCTKDGVAYDRCQASLHPPQCKNERSENQVEVMDEKGALMSTCTVWVKGVKYGIDCQDNGNRRRRLFQGQGGGDS